MDESYRMFGMNIRPSRSHPPRPGLLVVAVGAAVLVALVLAAPTAAYDRRSSLEHVASVFALRSAEVRCPTMPEWIADPIWGNGSNPQRAWGYTDMINEYIVLQPALCDGAAAITDTALPAWQRAVGTLTLVHEAYHLRRWIYRRNEGEVECRAIQNFANAAEFLGAPRELANDLLPYALAAHARMVRLFPEYRARRCRLPLWELPMTP
jgi:hypothetical protein